MDRDEALKLLSGGEEGIHVWNDHREGGAEIPSLAGINLSGANLVLANLSDANFVLANLSDANLGNANLIRANLAGADLIGANLGRASLIDANLALANLDAANLSNAGLNGANLTDSSLNGVNLEGASCGLTTFGNLDLSQAWGLDQVDHRNPSSVGMDTLSRSKGQISEAFLRGCGLSPWEVLSARLYHSTMTPPLFSDLQYQIFAAWAKGKDMINGCFISYSRNDSDFVEALRDRLMTEGVNVWLDRHDLVAGTIQDQVWRAIQLHHVVVLVLSKDSVRSDWVELELEMARKKEKDEGRAVLCPVALDDAWKAMVAATDGPGHPSRVLWRTLKEKLVIDFSPWQTKAFDETFGKLVRGLKVNYGPNDPPAS